MTVTLRIVMIAPLRFPIHAPFAGGLESAVWNEIRLLRARGHRVELIATEGSDYLEGGPRAFVLPAVDWHGDPAAADDTYPPGYLGRALPALDRALAVVAERAAAGDIDIVVNHCLHGLPLARAGEIGVPMVSTLHTPIVPELVASHATGRGRGSRFLAVSGHTSRTWSVEGVHSEVLHNGVDTDVWPRGDGGEGLVWFGRINHEKAPHLALQAAHLMGRPLTIAGRIGDQTYFDEEVAPLLDGDRQYVGPLGTTELASLVRRSACALTTPLWDEPFGLVTPEALLSGTPVAAFAIGGITELAVGSIGLTTVPVGDVAALAAAATALIAQSDAEPAFRATVSHAAAQRFSLSSRIVALEQIFAEAIADEALTDNGRTDYGSDDDESDSGALERASAA